MPKKRAVVKGVQVYGFRHLSEVVNFLNEPDRYSPMTFNAAEEFRRSQVNLPDLKDVKGQAIGRRAVEIAAAGGHNLIFVGQRADGKTMLAATFYPVFCRS
jgi:magnesium chelatase family protein